MIPCWFKDDVPVVKVIKYVNKFLIRKCEKVDENN